MELTTTVNADKRYYFDEKNIVNGESLIQTISTFNDMKIQLYNHLYEKKHHESGILTQMSYSQWLKDAFHTNDYYNCAVYTAASGQVSAQEELRKLYVKTVSEEIRNRKGKITRTKEDLSHKRAIKDSIRTYLKTGRWKKPYPKCTLKVSGSRISGSGIKKDTLVTDYERKVETDIRKLDTRLSLLNESQKRSIMRKENLETLPPKRIVFGTKKAYTGKDAEDVDIRAWKEDFSFYRRRSMSLPGRHTSKNCNYLVRYRNGDLIIRCMDGKEAVLKDFRLSRYGDIWAAYLAAKPKERIALCYNFLLEKDSKGRVYLIPSVTMPLVNDRLNESVETGCVAIDINYGNVSLSELDENGVRLNGEAFHFDLEGKSTGQISDIIGRVMSRVGSYCAECRKPLIMEDIDLTIKRHGLKYGGRKRNRHISMFAYRKMTSCILNQSYKKGFGVFFVDPSYTSQMGKFLFMRRMGISVHEAASYAIGLKGMGILIKLEPDPRLSALLPDGIRRKYAVQQDIPSLMGVWKKLAGVFGGVRIHDFYRGIPYQILKERKRPSLSSLSAEMKTWVPVYEG